MREILIKQTGKQLIRTSRGDIYILFTLLERHEPATRIFLLFARLDSSVSCLNCDDITLVICLIKLKHSPRFDSTVSRKCLPELGTLLRTRCEFIRRSYEGRSSSRIASREPADSTAYVNTTSDWSRAPSDSTSTRKNRESFPNTDTNLPLELNLTIFYRQRTRQTQSPPSNPTLAPPKKDSPESSTCVRMHLQQTTRTYRDSALEYQYQHRVTAGGKEIRDWLSI